MNTVTTRNNEGFIKAISIIMVTAFICLTLTGCGHKLSGRYMSKAGNYSVKFSSNGTCTWYQDGTYFDGTYYWDSYDECFYLDIRGSGLYTNTTFRAEPDPDGLIVNGGMVRNLIFSKRSGSNSSSIGIIIFLLILVLMLIGGGLAVVIILLSRKDKGTSASKVMSQNTAYPVNSESLLNKSSQDRRNVQNSVYVQNTESATSLTSASIPGRMLTQMNIPDAMDAQESASDENTMSVKTEEPVQEPVHTQNEVDLHALADTSEEIEQQKHEQDELDTEADESVKNINAFVPLKSFCTKCGAELIPNQNFCRRCGRKLK